MQAAVGSHLQIRQEALDFPRVSEGSSGSWCPTRFPSAPVVSPSPWNLRLVESPVTVSRGREGKARASGFEPRMFRVQLHPVFPLFLWIGAAWCLGEFLRFFTHKLTRLGQWEKSTCGKRSVKWLFTEATEEERWRGAAPPHPPPPHHHDRRTPLNPCKLAASGLMLTAGGCFSSLYTR